MGMVFHTFLILALQSRGGGRGVARLGKHSEVQRIAILWTLLGVVWNAGKFPKLYGLLADTHAYKDIPRLPRGRPNREIVH